MGTFSLWEQVISRDLCVKQMHREVEGYGGENLEVTLLWSVAVWGGTLSSMLTLWSLLKCPGISGSALVLIMQSKGPTAPAVLGGGSGGRAVSAVGWLL